MMLRSLKAQKQTENESLKTSESFHLKNHFGQVYGKLLHVIRNEGMMGQS